MKRNRLYIAVCIALLVAAVVERRDLNRRELETLKTDLQACSEQVTRLDKKLVRLNDSVEELRDKLRS